MVAVLMGPSSARRARGGARVVAGLVGRTKSCWYAEECVVAVWVPS